MIINDEYKIYQQKAHEVFTKFCRWSRMERKTTSRISGLNCLFFCFWRDYVLGHSAVVLNRFVSKGQYFHSAGNRSLVTGHDEEEKLSIYILME